MKEKERLKVVLSEWKRIVHAYYWKEGVTDSAVYDDIDATEKTLLSLIDRQPSDKEMVYVRDYIKSLRSVYGGAASALEIVERVFGIKESK